MKCADFVGTCPQKKFRKKYLQYQQNRVFSGKGWAKLHPVAISYRLA
jgi:hypothetical protein